MASQKSESIKNYEHIRRIASDFSAAILDQVLRPCLPDDDTKRKNFIDPFIDTNMGIDKNQIMKIQQQLRSMFIYGRIYFPIGTLLYCIRYAQEGIGSAPCIWLEVAKRFKDARYKLFYDILDQVSVFRNKKVAHGEERVTDAEEARQNMAVWIQCLCMMAEHLSE